MISPVLLQRSIGRFSNEIIVQHTTIRSLMIKASVTSTVRYPLTPNLHNNLNSNTVNYPLIKSFIRHQSNKPTLTPPTTTPTTTTKGEKHPPLKGTEVIVKDEEPKLSIWEKVKHEVNHYWAGTKLLGYEIKVSTKLLLKLMAGYELSRRESNQLQRTIVDVMRLVPFSMFILIPFAELLLPIALKLFPNLLPSTYETSSDRQKKKLKLRKARKSASEYIKQTMAQLGLKLLKKITEQEKEAFVSFFNAIYMGKKPSRDELIQVARLFKNDHVLDNLSRPQLAAMANYMSLRPFGTDTILRYQIRHRLLTIIKDDKAIDYEGVDSLTIPELQLACNQRGIKTSDVSPGRLREDLETWLDLRLRQKIPSTLLILSSAYTYGEKGNSIESYYDALLAVLSSIPDEVYNVAKLDLSDDSKLKLNILKEQEELIEEENQREKDTVTKLKDDIKLDEYEETATDGMKLEAPEVNHTTPKLEEVPVTTSEPSSESKEEVKSK